jgi:uncharacterized protein
MLGSAMARPDLAPRDNGALLYLSSFGSLSAAVDRVVGAGGQVVVRQLDLGAFGAAAIIVDSEGNRVGLLEPKMS